MKQGKDYIGVGVGAMIFNDKGELLLKKRSGEVRNERGCWEIPGGAVKFGETMAQSIVREVKEEVNLNVVIVEQLMAFDHLIPDEGQHWVSTLFIVKPTQGQTPKNLEPHKCDGLGWFAIDNLPSPLSIVTKLKIEAYQKRTSRN
jgi:mutator protein MutT